MKETPEAEAERNHIHLAIARLKRVAAALRQRDEENERLKKSIADAEHLYLERGKAMDRLRAENERLQGLLGPQSRQKYGEMKDEATCLGAEVEVLKNENKRLKAEHDRVFQANERLRAALDAASQKQREIVTWKLDENVRQTETCATIKLGPSQSDSDWGSLVITGARAQERAAAILSAKPEGGE